MKINNPAIDPIEYKDFLEIMNSMNEVFPNITHKSRIKFYHAAIKDLPLKALRDISIRFLTSSKQMPLPTDFKDAAREWLRANKTFVFDESQAPIDCNYCGDLGVISVHKPDDNSYHTLMRCNCTNHIFQSLAAPRWDLSLSGAFIRKPCPIEWFKPDIKFEAGQVAPFHPQVMDKVREWKTKKQQAEKYWSDLGYEHK